MDPANECVADIDIMELIKVEDVMEEFLLGPNASLIYCFDFLL